VTGSALNVPLSASAIALGYEFPMVPIDTARPAMSRRSVYQIDMYWVDSSGRRNTAVEISDIGLGLMSVALVRWRAQYLTVLRLSDVSGAAFGAPR